MWLHKKKNVFIDCLLSPFLLPLLPLWLLCRAEGGRGRERGKERGRKEVLRQKVQVLFNEHPHPSLPLSISLPLSADAYSKAPPTPTPTQLTTTGTFQVFYQRRSEHGKHVMQRQDQTTDGCKALHVNARSLPL